MLPALEHHDQLFEQSADQFGVRAVDGDLVAPDDDVAAGNACSIGRRLTSRWPSRAGIRCAPGTMTLNARVIDVIGSARSWAGRAREGLICPYGSEPA